MRKEPEDKQAETPLNQEAEAPMRRGPDPEEFHPAKGGGLSGAEVPAESRRGRKAEGPTS